MNLFGIDFAHQTSTGLFQQTVSGQTAASSEPVSPDAATTVETTKTSSPRTNMLAGSFVHIGHKESRYITSLKAGLAMQNSFMDKMQSVLAGYRYLVELSGDTSLGAKAAEAVSTMVDDEVGDTNAEKLKEIREDIEENADEATTPESAKALEDDTSPQEALEESLDQADQASQETDEAGTKVAPETGEAETKAAPETATDGKAVTKIEAADTELTAETAAAQAEGAAPETPVPTASLDIMV